MPSCALSPRLVRRVTRVRTRGDSRTRSGVRGLGRPLAGFGAADSVTAPPVGYLHSDHLRHTVGPMRGLRITSAFRRLARRLSGERGFTLPEMIVTVAILGIVVGGITTAFTSASKAEADLNRRFQ